MSARGKKTSSQKGSHTKKPSWYDILDVDPNATQEVLDRAYEKALAALEGGTEPSYIGSMTPEDRKKALEEVEVAFLTLSDSEKRADFDAERKMQETAESKVDPSPKTKSVKKKTTRKKSKAKAMTEKKRVSKKIRRKKTETTKKKASKKKKKTTAYKILEPVFEEITITPTNTPSASSSLSEDQVEEGRADNVSIPPPDGDAPASVGAELGNDSNVRDSSESLFEITQDTDVTGVLIQSIREARGLSIHEVADTTRIQKGYIRAIEEMRIEELPPRVYLRGYLTQIARMLGVNRDNLAKGYLRHMDRT